MLDPLIRFAIQLTQMIGLAALLWGIVSILFGLLINQSAAHLARGVIIAFVGVVLARLGQGL